MSDDERAIRELIETWMGATRAGDSDTVLELMSDDAVFLVPGKAPFGKEAFRHASQAMTATRIDGRSDVEELVVAGDWAFCRAHLALTVTGQDGTAFHRAGYTLTIFRKQPDGRWVLARDANLLTAT